MSGQMKLSNVLLEKRYCRERGNQTVKFAWGRGVVRACVGVHGLMELCVWLHSKLPDAGEYVRWKPFL